MKHCKPLVFLIGFLALAGFSAAGAEEKSPGPESVKEFLSGFRLLEKKECDNLTIVPMQGPAWDGGGLQISALDEVMPGGKLIIREVSESGAVNTLYLKNDSDTYVFIMAGEILTGAKQDRILQADVILPPHSKEITVPVFCVEHGRWVFKSDRFYSENISAPVSIRQQAQISKDQSKVWEEVASNNSYVDARTDTGTLSATYRSGKVLRQKGKYEKVFADLPGKYPQATGVVVLVNGKVMAADLFGRRHVFKVLWKKLLDSYIAEAVRRRDANVPSEIASAAAFMEMAAGAGITLTESPGTGSGIELSAAKVKGSGVLLVPGVVHIDLFPAISTIPEQAPLQRQYFRR